MARNKSNREETYNSPFATTLRKLMEERGASQGDIATITSRTRQTVSQYVNGVSEPPFETLVKIADYFDVSIDYLLGRTRAQSLTPSAVDQLGLSEKAVSNLVDLCHSPIMGNAIDGVNMFMENAHFFFAARDAAAFKELVKKELAYREKNKEKLSKENPFSLDGAEYDLEVMEVAACRAVAKLFPEFADRIEVTIGKHYIEHERQRIVGTFETCLTQSTKYIYLQFPGLEDE